MEILLSLEVRDLGSFAHVPNPDAIRPHRCQCPAVGPECDVTVSAEKVAQRGGNIEMIKARCGERLVFFPQRWHSVWGECSMPSEIDTIVVEVLEGDTEAFGRIIRLYQQTVWRIVSIVLRDRDATENLVQHVFVDAYMHLDSYRIGTDFGAWMRTIARNRIRQEARTIGRENKRMAVYADQLAERFRDEERADRADELYLDALRRCREVLPERAARLIDRRYVHSESFTEIAAAEDSTPEAIQRAISRLRAQLRECIESRLAQS